MKLRRHRKFSWGPDNRGHMRSLVGSYFTRDMRYLLWHEQHGWKLRAQLVPDQKLLERHGLNGQQFPTRRETLEALALALHFEEQG